MKKGQFKRKAIEKKPYISMNLMGVFDVKEQEQKVLVEEIE